MKFIKRRMTVYQLCVSGIYRRSFKILLQIAMWHTLTCMGYMVVRSRRSASYMKMCVKCLKIDTFVLKCSLYLIRAELATGIFILASFNSLFLSPGRNWSRYTRRI